MSLTEQKASLEAAKFKLWKVFFKGNANKGTHKQIAYIDQQLEKIRQVMYPQRKRN